jgi:HEAT repeat protein
LDACLQALNPVAAQRTLGWSVATDAQLAARLEVFGPPAKRELLKRAAGEDRGWRKLSDAILMYWPHFEPADVPLLVAALHKNPGGWVARPLGVLGTRAAIDALVEDVRLHGAMSQSSWALAQVGDRVFPYLLPLLSDEKRWRDAAEIMSDMKANAARGLATWLVIALDPARSEQDRIGALRGIGILGSSAKQVAPQLRPLLTSSDSYGPIQEMAKAVLMAMADESMASEAVACQPSSDPFEGSFDSATCLERAAAYGPAILPYANLILTQFTESRTGSDRANGAAILGYIGYIPAKQRLIELLSDPDWRVVYAATRSLGWLRATDAMPALSVIAKDHWLADVREQAAKVILDLQSPAGAAARPTVRDGTLAFPPSVQALEIDAMSAPDIAPCESGRWKWRTNEFGRQDRAQMALHIAASGGLPAGDLEGRDSGEWGGEVKWRTGSSAPTLVTIGNVEGLAANDDGAIAIIGGGGAWSSYDPKRPEPSGQPIETITVSNGAGGSGFAIALRRDASGAWRSEEVARFPRTAFDLRTIGHNLFAAWSGNRAIVFTPKGIAGVAQCLAARK